MDNEFLKREVGVDLKVDSIIFCHDCYNKINAKQLPRIHTSNGLELEEVPDELKMKDLEQQLIAKDLIFMKIKKLPTSRMHANFDRVISVPIDDETVSKTISELPRHPNDANIVAVQLKRKLEMKNTHLEEYIRPKFLVRALEKLKELKNPFYQDIKINEDFLNPSSNSDEKDDEEETEEESKREISFNERDAQLEDNGLNKTEGQKAKNLNPQQIIEKAESKSSQELDTEDNHKKDDEDHSDNEENGKILPNVKAYQSKQDEFTCLMPTDLSDKLEVNSSDSVKTKERGEGRADIKIAPGEGKVPSNIMREINFDVKAFVRHHPSGKFGLNYDRKCRLSPKVYFNQRLLNADERFCKDPCYVFMASYYCERHSIEQKIDVSGQKGKTLTENGEVTVNLVDPFDVFKTIKGSPKYWQVSRNELVAKVKQLGPFHVFYTFSCGEMRWPEVFISVLESKGRKVIIPDGWNGNEAELYVEEDGKQWELWTYVNDIMSESKHELFKDYIFLITRHFDARVKSFISNILMGNGSNKVPFKHFSYRVEFQARGMPHIHGVAWIEESYLQKKGLSDPISDGNSQKVIELADELISCCIPEGQDEESIRLKEIVTEVQIHHHTPSCKKYNGNCR